MDIGYNWTIISRTCLLCEGPLQPDQVVCASCHRHLPWIEHPCPCCGRAMAVAADGLHPCGDCQRHPPHYHRSTAPFLYQPPISRLIKQMKFHQRLDVARILGLMLAGHLAQVLEDRPQAIVPVPLHRRRLRERGYNQALELARPVAARLGIPIDTRLVQRVRPTLEQSHLQHAERKGNIRDAFDLDRHRPYRHVAILDDVVTTGHTVDELARVLKRAGVERVDVWSCCRATGKE